MAVTKIISGAIQGIEAQVVEVEVDITTGIPALIIVGLPDASINEAKERLKAAIKNAGFGFPLKKVVINLAPADLKKIGTGFDLPMAVGLLQASEYFAESRLLENTCFVGELSLDGSIRPVKGVIAIAQMAKQAGYHNMVVATENQQEAALIEGLKIYGVAHLSQLPQLLDNPEGFACQLDAKTIVDKALKKQRQLYPVDFKDIQGQRVAKRALEIAAAGGHNVAFFGPPGSGKSLMAKAFAGILPPMDFEEMLEVSRIYSISGQLQQQQLPLMINRPFRSPHHSASMAGLVGGGNPPKPGEITLSHRGVLFLDEFTEFPRQVLEVLRQPLEDDVVTVSRAQLAVTFPANFTLLVAMNPCPCGYLGDSQKNCICSSHMVQRYLGKLSGPLMDRIDMEIEVPRLADSELIQKNRQADGESSAEIQQRVIAARDIQKQRFEKAGMPYRLNSEMPGDALKLFCQLDPMSEQLMAEAIRRFQLSGRAFDRLLKLSRTIADLESSDGIQAHHLAEALQYRCYEKLMQTQVQSGNQNYLAKTA